MSFYLHYPWLFSTEIVRQLIHGTEDEEVHEAVMSELESSTHPPGSDCLDLDQYIRLISSEDWNWQAVQATVRPVIQLQIARAYQSQGFYGLFQRLQKETAVATATLHDDTQNALKTSETSFNELNAEMELRDGSFVTQEELKSLSDIFSGYCRAQEEDWRLGAGGAIVGDVSPWVTYFHLLAVTLDVRDLVPW